MNKFKKVFYPIYIITVILVVVTALNIMEALTLFQHWGFWKYFNELPFIGRNLILFLALLMTIEIVVENISIFRLKGKMKDHDEEVTLLKAKLYDQSQEDEDDDDSDESFEFDEDDD